MILALLLGSIFSFSATFLATPYLAELFKERGVVGKDVHKPSKPICAEMGGASILLGFTIGFCTTLLTSVNVSVSLIYAFLTIFLAGCVGIVDDLFTLRQRYKPFLVALASIPLVCIGFGRQGFWFPLIGSIFVGSFYLILVPIGVATASNMTNMLAGFNGLESGIGAVSCFALGVVCALSETLDACCIAFPLSAAFLAFLRYNWYPAKVFPGDTGTLLSGAAIATVSIFSGVEFAGMCMVAPAAIDFTLKMASKRPFSQRKSLGDTTVADNNVLMASPYPALPHAFMRLARLTERELVSSLLFMQGVYSAIGVIITSLLQ